MTTTATTKTPASAAVVMASWNISIILKLGARTAPATKTISCHVLNVRDAKGTKTNDTKRSHIPTARNAVSNNSWQKHLRGHR